MVNNLRDGKSARLSYSLAQEKRRRGARVEVIEYKLDNRTIKIFPVEDVQQPVVFSSEFDGDGSEILQEYAALDCPSFHLVAIFDINWDEDLVPWEANRIPGNQDHLTGGARAYLDWLLSVVVLLAQHELGEYYNEAFFRLFFDRIFTPWSSCQIDIFKGEACVLALYDFLISRKMRLLTYLP